MQSVQKSAQQKMLMREPSKQPIIGRDRLSALRNSNSSHRDGGHSSGGNHSHSAAGHHSLIHAAPSSGGHQRNGSGKLAPPQLLPLSTAAVIQPAREENV